LLHDFWYILDVQPIRRSKQWDIHDARKIVIVAPWAHRLGGAEEMLLSLLTHLDPTQADVARVVFLEHGPLADDVAGLGCQVSSLRSGRLPDSWRGVATVRSLAQNFRRDRPDVVLSWMAKAHRYSRPAAIAVGLRQNCMWRQHMVPDGHRIDRMATGFLARVVAASSIACPRAQEAGRPRRSTFVVWQGVEFDRFLPEQTSRRAVRDSIGFGYQKLVAAIIVRLKPWKRQHHVIAATADLRADGIDPGVIAVGGEVLGGSEGVRRSASAAGAWARHRRTCSPHWPGRESDPVYARRGRPRQRIGARALRDLAGRGGGDRYSRVRGGQWRPREIIEGGKTGILIHRLASPNWRPRPGGWPLTPRSAGDSEQMDAWLPRDRLMDRMASGFVVNVKGN
jgi:hypothetical protein